MLPGSDRIFSSAEKYNIIILFFWIVNMEEREMPWYWILIILSAIIGPFEAMHALNKARKNREAAEKRKAGPDKANQKG